MKTSSEMRLQEIDAFLAVARAGSFVGASRDSGAPISTLSRRVGLLEQRLGVQLLKRSTRALTLTDDGRAFAERCGAALAEIAATVAAVRDQSAKLSGRLRVTAPQYACNDEFAALLIEFAGRHGDLQLDVRLTNGVPDLVEDNIDLAFQLSPLADTNNVARRLWSVPYVLCASPNFLADQDETGLAHPRGLAALSCVVTPPIDTWWFDHPDLGSASVIPRRFAARVDDLGLGLRAVLTGLGFGFLPRGLAGPHLGSGLREIQFAGWHAKDRELYAVYPPSRQLSAKVRALIDFALEARAAHA